MRHRPAPRLALLSGLTVLAAVAAGCAVDPAGPAESSAPESASGSGLPMVDVAGFTPLTVHLTVPQEEAPPGTTGRPFGCGDLLVPVQTQAADTPDAANTALDFLFSERQGEHGDPPLYNAVNETRRSLTPTGHHRAGDVEVFTFTGSVDAAGECAAARIRAQLQETARAHTSAGQVRLEVDGRDLDELLGLAPLSLGAEVSTDNDDDAAAASESAAATGTASAEATESAAPSEPALPTASAAPTENATPEPAWSAEPSASAEASWTHEPSSWSPEPSASAEPSWTPEPSSSPEPSSWSSEPTSWSAEPSASAEPTASAEPSAWSEEPTSSPSTAELTATPTAEAFSANATP